MHTPLPLWWIKCKLRHKAVTCYVARLYAKRYVLFIYKQAALQLQQSSLSCILKLFSHLKQCRSDLHQHQRHHTTFFIYRAIQTCNNLNIKIPSIYNNDMGENIYSAYILPASLSFMYATYSTGLLICPKTAQTARCYDDLTVSTEWLYRGGMPVDRLNI